MFKEVNKAQNPYNTFYLQIQKCIGKTAHNTFYKFIKFVITYYFTESEEKGILG